MAKVPRKTLVFCSWFPNRVQPTNGNFVEKHLRAIACFHPISAFQVEYDPSLCFGQNEWIETQQDNYDLITIYYGNPFGKIARFIHRLVLCWHAFRYLSKKKGIFDLFHIHVAMPGVFIAYIVNKIYKIPFVLTCHSTGFLPNETKTYPKWQRKLLMILASKAKVVSPVSETLGKALQENGLKAPIQIIPNVVNTKYFYPSKNSSSSSILKLLHISNFHPKAKNVEGLLRVVKQLSLKKMPFQLTIAGDGDLERVQSYALQLGLSKDIVRFHGALSELEVANMMREHHVYVLFSNFETQGVTLLEAQCCGLMIITTRVGGIPEIITKEWIGVMVEVGDEKALETEITQQIQNYTNLNSQKELKKRRAKHAYDRYSEETVGGMFIELYNKVKIEFY